MEQVYETLKGDPAMAGVFAAATPALSYDPANDMLVVDRKQMATLTTDAVIGALNNATTGMTVKIAMSGSDGYKLLAKLTADVTLRIPVADLTASFAGLPNLTALALDERSYEKSSLGKHFPLLRILSVKTVYFLPPPQYVKSPSFDNGYYVDLAFLGKNTGLENLVVYTDGGAFNGFANDGRAATRGALGKLVNLRSVVLGARDGTPKARTSLDAEFYGAVKEFCPKLQTINGKDAATFDPAAGLSDDDLRFYNIDLAANVLADYHDGRYQQGGSARMSGSAVIVADLADPHFGRSAPVSNFNDPGSFTGYKGKLADAVGSADRIALIYVAWTRVASYTNGGAAYRAKTYVSIVDPNAKTATKPHLIGSTEPPNKISGGYVGAGKVLWDKAMSYFNGLV